MHCRGERSKEVSGVKSFDFESTHINQIAEIFDEVFVDRRVGGFQTQLVLVFGFQGLQPGLGVLVLALRRETAR